MEVPGRFRLLRRRIYLLTALCGLLMGIVAFSLGFTTTRGVWFWVALAALAINAFFVATDWLRVRSLKARRQRVYRNVTHHCVNCGYNLTGLIARNTRVMCPECGTNNKAATPN